MRASEVLDHVENFSTLFEDLSCNGANLSALNEHCLRMQNSLYDDREINSSDMNELRSLCSPFIGICNSILSMYDLTNTYFKK